MYCEEYHTPWKYCPSSTRYDFAVVEPEQCLLYPEHIQMETAGYRYVDIHDNDGQVVGRRPFERFVPTGPVADFLASQQRPQQSRALQRTPSSHRPWPHLEPVWRSPVGTAPSGNAVAEPRPTPTPTPPTVAGPSRSRTHDPVVAGPSFTPATPIHEAKEEAEAEASTPAEFADQEQRVDEAIQNYRSTQASIPNRGRRMERTNTAGSSASDSVHVSPSNSQVPAGKRRSSSMPAEAETSDAPATVPALTATSTLDPSLPPFIPKSLPGTPNDKGKGKEVVRPAPHVPSTPAKEPAKEQEQGSAAPMTQSTIPPSPAPTGNTDTTTAASSDTRSPSVRGPTVIEASEFPSLQATALPQMASTDRPAVRSWASIVGPMKQQQRPVPALPKPAQMSQKQQQKQGQTTEDKKDYSTGATTGVTNKPARSYSAALASGNNGKGAAMTPVKATGNNSDWPAPPPSWGRGSSGGRK
ncbi:hypothetical protein PG996_005074 [Apiospora saccharicola]|uniref:Uncharacterized protein n=1 Tax=Apiospora saccharicola TaxID=335842 RepID=A0ABR1VKG3_9PEZI